MQDWVYRLDHDAVVIAESRLPAPLVTFLGDGRWRLERAYDHRDGETTITVPAGFEFDLSSVPRIFWSLIAPFELSIAAPLLHDFLYRYGGKPPVGSVRPGAELHAGGGRPDVPRDHARRGRFSLAADSRLCGHAHLRPVGLARLKRFKKWPREESDLPGNRGPFR